MPSWSLLDEVEDTFAHITTNAVASDARSLCASSASRNHVHLVFVAMALACAMRSYFGMNNYHQMSSMLSNAESPSSQPFVDSNLHFGGLSAYGTADLNARCRPLHPTWFASRRQPPRQNPLPVALGRQPGRRKRPSKANSKPFGHHPSVKWSRIAINN